MFNLFKSFKEKRNKKRQSKRLEQISSVFGLMERLVKSGLLYWEQRRRRLFIAEPLAVVILARGAQPWINFLNNVYQYMAYIHMAELWDRQLVSRQNRAVADARRSRPNLTSDEIKSIRRGAVAEMAEDDVALPKIEAIEFFVIADTKGGKAETTFCGIYDPDTDNLDMVMWEDVQAAVSAYHKQ